MYQYILFLFSESQPQLWSDSVQHQQVEGVLLRGRLGCFLASLQPRHHHQTLSQPIRKILYPSLGGCARQWPIGSGGSGTGTGSRNRPSDSVRAPVRTSRSIRGKESCDTVKMPNKPKKEKVSWRLRAVAFHAGSRRGPEAAVVLADEDFGCCVIELANLAG